MQVSSFEVVVDRGSQHCFVYPSKTYVETILRPTYNGHVPTIVPLRLIGEAGKDVYVGCLTSQPHTRSTFQLLFPLNLCSDLGLREGELIECVPLRKVPQATKVVVAPLTVDDSEVVEHNALRIESQLLRQVQVVFPSMVISVGIFAGVTAKVVVNLVECADGETLQGGGCATMHEGTYFLIATRSRKEQSPSASQPLWAFLRGRPPAMRDDAAEHDKAVARVNAAVAEEKHWKNGMVLGALDCALVVKLEEPSLTPSFLRKHQRQVTVEVDDEVESGSCVLGWLRQATNVLLTPQGTATAEASVDPVEMDTATVTRPPAAFLTFQQVEAVHGSVPGELKHHLTFALQQPPTEHLLQQSNVLVCGGRGYGKSAVVYAVLQEMPDVHAIHLECTDGKNFLPSVRQALAECVLCQPSVLVLHHFDRIAPEQKEGNASAISAATAAALDSILTRFSCLPSVRQQGGCGVVVVATCTNREAVNASLSSVYSFRQVLQLESLNRVSRATLLGQLFPTAVESDVTAATALMDNYTPFDVRQVAARMRAKLAAQPEVSLRECAEQCVPAFTPLAHSGIQFLKGEKVEWNSIGGLTLAKKVLHDTLVLPIKHPQLFAKLPLKTRSGILLYGPSGCGKTFIIESLVNAEGLHCIVVNGPEVFGKYIGQSEQKIRDVFERAQAAAPCVVFFDEFDSVAPQRGVDNSGVTDRVVNQLLCYLDGVEGRKDVYVVAASSRPDLIDAALLRPGRLDKAVVCPIPTTEDREAILQSLLSKTTTQLTPGNIREVAELTVNWTPADLSAMVSTANTLVNQRFMEAALTQHTAGMGGLPAAGESDAFFIAGVATGQTREKVADSVKLLLQNRSGDSATSDKKTFVPESIAMSDMIEAMQTTRPSLSEKDIKKHEKIHALFSQGKGVPPPTPGTKLTTS